MIYQVLYLLCVWLPLRAKEELSREGQKAIQTKACAGKHFVRCELSSRGQKVRSQRHLYICHIFFQLHRLPCVWTSSHSQIIFSVLLWGTHTACHIPRTQHAGEKHQVPRRQIQILGIRLSNASFIQSPIYISYIKTKFCLINNHFTFFLYHSFVMPLSSLHKLK